MASISTSNITSGFIDLATFDEIEKYIDLVLQEYPEKVLEYKSGKKGLMGLFVGEVMKKSGGKSDPKITTKLLNEKLS